MSQEWKASIVNDVINNPDTKWPKIQGYVIVPFTFPRLASKQDKADIAHVVTEFEEKTCIR